MTLADRIAARLHEVLDHMEGAAVSSPEARRGLAYGGPDDPILVLTVEQLAKLVADVAERP